MRRCIEMQMRREIMVATFPDYYAQLGVMKPSARERFWGRYDETYD